MPAKTLTFDREAREKLLEGARILERAVGATLGPRSNNVAIDRGYDIWVIKDGVNVARQIEVKDPAVNAGIRIIREAANKQVQIAGDGTTAVTILALAILEECDRMIASGIRPMSLTEDLEKGQQLLIDEIEKISIPVKTLQQKIQVATISANGDKELGKMIGETIDKIGADGILTVEESKSNETYIELQEGMQFDKGYVSPYFLTDEKRMEATVENPYILITDMVLSNINQLLPLLQKVGGKSKNMVIIAQDITDSMLASMIATKMDGGMNLLGIQSPLSGMGQKMKDWLMDIAILTGGTVISEDAGHDWNTVEIESLGHADRVTSTLDATLIVGGKGTKESITGRVDSLRAQIERREGSEFEQKKLQERMAKLTNGVAVLNVGGETEVEMKERKERADDAIASTQAAVAEGIVAGGEVVYLTAREVLDKKNSAHRVLYNALVKPFEKLYTNAGFTPYDMIPLIMNRKVTEGIDVTDGTLKDMIKSGIIDATLVSKTAIRNAVSVAIKTMTTSVIITNEPEEKK